MQRTHRRLHSFTFCQGARRCEQCTEKPACGNATPSAVPRPDSQVAANADWVTFTCGSLPSSHAITLKSGHDFLATEAFCKAS